MKMLLEKLGAQLVQWHGVFEKIQYFVKAIKRHVDV
jgi:hypothetical protein